MVKVEDHPDPMNNILWDRDSSLYDSFELKSFKRQLDAAIVSRTPSMPHISFNPPPALPPKKQPSKLGRRLHNFIRSVFRRKVPNYLQAESWQMEHGKNCTGVYTLTTIPDDREKVMELPEFDPVVRKTVSERLASTAGLVVGDAGGQ